VKAPRLVRSPLRCRVGDAIEATRVPHWDLRDWLYAFESNKADADGPWIFRQQVLLGRKAAGDIVWVRVS